MPWSHRAASYYEADAEGRFRVVHGPGAHQSLRGSSPVARRRTVPDGRRSRVNGPRGRSSSRSTWPCPGAWSSAARSPKRARAGPSPERSCASRPYPTPGGPPPSLSVPAVTGPDGTYRVAAPPGPGYLVVQGPDDDYVLREFGGDGAMYVARPGRRRLYAHAYRAVDLKPGGPDQEVDLTLRRGAATPRPGRRPGRSTRPGRLGLQPAHAANPAGRRMETVDRPAGSQP